MQNGVDTHEDKLFELPVHNKNDITAEDNTNKTAGKRSRMKRDMLLKGETTNPVEVTFEDVSAAAFRIKSGIRRTPCEVRYFCISIANSIAFH